MLSAIPNVMVDLETMGTDPRSAIIAIGAVEFNVKEGTKVFYETVSLESSMKAGCSVSAATILWWLEQSAEARNEVIDANKQNGKAISLTDALDKFRTWFPKSARVWGNGAAFDNVILANAYRAIGQEPPWKFWNDRCYRTMKSEYSYIRPAKFSGTQHNALDDALHQAAHLIKIWKFRGANQNADNS